MEPRVVMASTFKQQCLALLDQVETTGVPVVVTKRGRPVAQVVPLTPHPSELPTMGSVTLLAEHDADYFSAGETWGADSGDAP